MRWTVRYECEHCGKLFKANKHFCFKDPANKSCSTCDNYRGRETDIHEDGGRWTYYLCEHDGEVLCIYDYYTGSGNDIPFRSRNGRRGYNCDWWTPRKEEEKP